MAQQLNKRRDNSSTGVRFSYEGIGIIICIAIFVDELSHHHIFLIHLLSTDMWLYHLCQIELILNHIHVMVVST